MPRWVIFWLALTIVGYRRVASSILASSSIFRVSSSIVEYLRVLSTAFPSRSRIFNHVLCTFEPHMVAYFVACVRNFADRVIVSCRFSCMRTLLSLRWRKVWRNLYHTSMMTRIKKKQIKILRTSSRLVFLFHSQVQNITSNSSKRFSFLLVLFLFLSFSLSLPLCHFVFAWPRWIKRF